MRFNRYFLPAAAGLALLLAACGGQPGAKGDKGTGNTPPKNGVLELVVAGVDQAPVQVVGLEGVAFSGTVKGSKKLTLPAGPYLIDGGTLKGYIDPSPTKVELKAGATVKRQLAYQKVIPSTGPPDRIEIVKVADGDGLELPYLPEENINAVKKLFASQTEEPVCVTVKVTDASGNPVEGAQIAITSSQRWVDDHVSILRNCAKSQTEPQGGAKPLAFRDGIFTDADGMATFTLYATWSSLEDAPLTRILLGQLEPTKLVIAAEGQGATVLDELKFFFFNISHLWAWMEGKDYPTQTRWGKAFELTNLFNPNCLQNRDYQAATQNGGSAGDCRKDNAFEVRSHLFFKQPQRAIPLGIVGYIVYEISGDDAGRVHFEGADNLISPTKAIDYDGAIAVVPNDDVGLEDMPLDVDLKATLYAVAPYGENQYAFPLKSYTVHKRWVGSYLKIEKKVDHHVLSWYGPDHTLDAANAVPANSVFTSTVSITVTNAGNFPVYNVTVSDDVPFELGVIESTLNPSGGTYDAVNHTVTWNWQNTADPRFDKLDPGDSITVTFQVYVRQKPGFCADKAEIAAAKDYYVQPGDVAYKMDQDHCYSDPYKVVNGAKKDDVTGTWYTGAPLGQGGFQVMVDFNGKDHEKDVVIWAVRPILKLDKKIFEPADRQMAKSNISYWRITFKNLDRAIYNGLMAAYPDEFNGAPGRDNPYARNLDLTDVFDTGLDFVSSSPATVTDDDTGTSTDYAENYMAPKGIRWAQIPLMGGGDSGEAQPTLRGNIEGVWFNCAFLNSPSLNQPRKYAEVQTRTLMSWQFGLYNYSWSQYPLHHNDNAGLRKGLQACDYVKVQLADEPWIELDSLGEYDGSNPNTAKQLPGVNQNDTYYYFMTVTNVGNATAQNVSFQANITQNRANFTANASAHKVYTASSASGPWTFLGSASSASATNVQFSPAGNLSAGEYFLFVLEAKAMLVGNENVEAESTYTNPASQAPFLPAMSSENTQIQ